MNPSRRPHVLLVEDDPAIARMYKVALTQYGYDVELSRDGEAGVAAVEKRHPDVVLLDIRLPRLDGFGVLDRLQEHITSSELKVIVLTNDGLDESVNACFARGAAEYVTKAMVTPRELAQVIARNLVPAGH